MTVYAETRGEETINWNLRLDSIINMDIETPTNEEVKRWKDQSESWITCAVGNACDVIPRCEKGRPYDEELAELGVQFYHKMKAVYNAFDHVAPEVAVVYAAQARSVLDSIEKRSSALIEGINSQAE